MTAAERGWGPAPAPRSAIVPVKLGAAQVNAPPGVHRRIAPLVVELARRWETVTGDLLVDGWCWGYAPRKVRGSTSRWSNHAWGLAVDFNAPRWPMGSSRLPAGAFRMRREAADLGFRWGADWTRPDVMHFEFAGTPADAAGHIARLGIATTATEEDPVLTNGQQGPAVKAVQRALLDDDPQSLPRFGPDGQFGSETAGAVEAWQSRMGLPATGNVDGLTAALLLADPTTWPSSGASYALDDHTHTATVELN